MLVLVLWACVDDKTKQPLTLPQNPVEIIYDIHGIPHIYAQSDIDVFYGQGYAMAELRPAQNEIFRLWSQGRRSELFGKDKLRTDMFVRAMNFLGHAQKNYSRIQETWPEIVLIAEAFAAGINARYQEYRQTGWPPTIQVLIAAGYTPSDWTAVEVIAIEQLLAFGLAGSPDVEIEITLAKALLGDALFEDLFIFTPPTSAYTVPGFTQAALAGRSVEKWSLATEPDWLPFNPLLGLDLSASATLRQALKELRDDFTGSNNFAMAGNKMQDGLAVVASDTHQGVPYPGSYVLMHLNSVSRGGTGTQNIIGAAFPGVPMVVFGHNGKVCWAPTTGYSDVVDFYWEFLDPHDPLRVQRPHGQSLPFRERAESFKIRNHDGSFRYESVLVRDIENFGPILPVEILPLPAPVKISVRWTGTELPGPAWTVLGLSRSQTIDDMFMALRDFVGGTIGFTMGSIENRIAYSLWTKTPKRDTSGIYKPWFIIPAALGPHWDGYLPFEKIPFWIDPDRGYLWSANNDPSGNSADNDPGNDGYYYGFTYALGDRAQRLDQLLGHLANRGNVTMSELENVQVDLYSIFGDQLIPYFAAAVTRRADLITSDLQFYVDAITTWNRIASSDSYQATIFYHWAYQFYADAWLDDFNLIDDVSGSSLTILARAMIKWLRETNSNIDAIDSGLAQFPSQSGRNFWDNRNTTDVVETRDEIMIQALKKAVAHLQDVAERGATGQPQFAAGDFSTWHWGRKLFLDNRHTLAEIEPTWQRYDKPRPGWGNVDTVNVGQFVGYSDGQLRDRFVLSNAPSNRFIWQMHPNGIRGKFMVPWGQSEIPENQHYDDLVQDYLDFVYRDFAYTDSEVASVIQRKQILRQARQN